MAMEDQFLKIAKQAALEAGEIIKKYSGKTTQKNIKHEDISDFATEADLEAEKKIVAILSTAFPNHNILAEENTRIDNKSEYTWVIDPLDGTFSFSVGIPYYSVSIGLLKDNKPFMGVIYNISMNQLSWAEKDKGAYQNGERIYVSGREKLEGSAVSLELGHRQKRSEKINRYILPLILKIGYPYSFGSAVATLGTLACGILDAYIVEAWIWDLAAGAIIIKEAGGKVTDLEGKEPDWSKERLNVVVSNGLIHNEILEALKQ